MGAQADDTVRIALVCRANVCRSPLAEAVLPEVTWHLPLRVVAMSAGLRPAQTDRRCAVAGERLVRAGLPASPDHHVPRDLDALELDEVDMVLCAERSLCREVIGTRPALRGMVFTFTEAAPLARWVLDRHGAALRGLSPVEAVRAVVARMPDARVHVLGTTPVPPARRGLRPRPRTTTDPWDIQDGHLSSSRRTHEDAADRVIRSMRALAETLDDIVRASQTRTAAPTLGPTQP